MRNLFSILFFISFFSFGQSDKWKLSRFDDMLSFELPEDYYLTDTLDLFAFNAQGKFGFLMVMKTSDAKNPIRTDSEEQIEKLYDSFQHGFSTSQNAVMISDKPVKIGNFTARQCVYRTIVQRETKRLEVILLIVKSSLYSFMYSYDYQTSQAAAPERDRFFSSITPKPSFTINDQLTDYSPDVEAGKKFGMMMRNGTILAVVLCIILWVKKKFKAVRIIKKVVGIAIGLLGLFNLLVYWANASEGIEFNKIKAFLWAGLIFLSIGLILFFIRIPKPKAQKIDNHSHTNQ